MKTYMAKGETVERKWYVVDADGMVLGRLASQVATILRGKHKPIYTPHVDTGDFVIIINADKVVLTGRKLDQKKYYHHSGYPGGIKETSYRTLPKGPLGRQMLKKLRVYRGDDHKHVAQQPETLVLKSR